MRHEKSYRVVFSSRDYSLLLKIKKCFNCNYRISRNQRPDGIDYQLILYSKHLFQRLLALGGFRRKSKKVGFPQIPTQYLSDFIRGYFDGDGSVFYTTYIHTKTKKPRTELRSNFTSGDPKFLEDLQNILVNTLGFIRKKVCPFNKGASWKLGYGTYDTKRLLKFMYYSNYLIGLKRKALFAKQF
jgi:intein/homing endonuclease